MNGGGTGAIVAALPREIRGLVGHTAPDRSLLPSGIHLYRLGQVVIVAAGMGSARAAVGLQAAMAAATIDFVLSAGLAGACSAMLPAGTLVEADLVIDARTGERFRTASSLAQTPAEVVLVTTEAIAGIREKTRLAAAYGAAMVDMEAATLARLALAHNLPFGAIKGISDAHDFELASLARFAGSHGQFRTAAFALHTAVRPHQWRHAARLGRHSNRALAALHARLRQFL